MKTDLGGNPIKPPPKCKHCGKIKWNHKASTYECPVGSKARAVGYTSFGPNVFKPKGE